MIKRFLRWLGFVICDRHEWEPLRQLGVADEDAGMVPNNFFIYGHPRLKQCTKCYEIREK